MKSSISSILTKLMPLGINDKLVFLIMSYLFDLTIFSGYNIRSLTLHFVTELFKYY